MPSRRTCGVVRGELYVMRQPFIVLHQFRASSTKPDTFDDALEVGMGLRSFSLENWRADIPLRLGSQAIVSA